jgi:ubiquinone/menaquinone biosynthesis C-methylase UbiE
VHLSKQGEIDYLDAIGEEGLKHALNKPFSDDLCGQMLSDLGAIMSLLPLPPARLLDFGCGTGWTSCFFAQRGYEVTGVDISSIAIQHAEASKNKMGLKNLNYLVGDYESISLEDSFDCAVFYHSLHHSEDYEAALKTAFRSLKSYGVCLTCEPGLGHARQKTSLQAVGKYQVTEKDMPPQYIIKAARRVGFRKYETYPCWPSIGKIVNERLPRVNSRFDALIRELFSFLVVIRTWLFKQSLGSLVKLTKGDLNSSIRGQLKAKLNIEINEREIKEGEAIGARATIKNISPAIWLPTNADKGAVHLGCHLLDRQGKMIARDFFRQKLSPGSGRQILPKESITVQTVIPSPSRGDYILEFDLVAEGVCWFAENGSETVPVSVTVV